MRACNTQPNTPTQHSAELTLQRPATRSTHARRGHYVSARGPAVISTVHPKNAALVHVLAAEQAHTPAVGGRPFFSRDFEANVVDMYLDCFRGIPGLTAVLLPAYLAYALAWVLDRLDRLMHVLARCVGRRWESSEDAVDIAAAGMLWMDIIVSDRAAKQVLGYAPLVTHEECLRDAADWSKQFYSQLDAKK